MCYFYLLLWTCLISEASVSGISLQFETKGVEPSILELSYADVYSKMTNTISLLQYSQNDKLIQCNKSIQIESNAYKQYLATNASQRKTTDITSKMAHSLFSRLIGICYPFEDGKYTYQICPFIKIVQIEHLKSMSYLLGISKNYFENFTDPKSQQEGEISPNDIFSKFPIAFNSSLNMSVRFLGTISNYYPTGVTFILSNKSHEVATVSIYFKYGVVIQSSHNV